jgi:hypothetical protein
MIYWLHEVHIDFLRSAELLFQGVHTETMGSILDDGKKYDVHIWKVHMITIGSTHTVDVDGKYIASILGSAKSRRRIAKMLKKHSQN